jgi:hypothetical protein
MKVDAEYRGRHGELTAAQASHDDQKPAAAIFLPTDEECGQWRHQVRYFLAFARTLNFNKAACECNVSPRLSGSRACATGPKISPPPGSGIGSTH